jgi:hypothetical protein
VKTGRNEPCPCGSGKKYKRCCLDRDSGWVPPEVRAERARLRLEAWEAKRARIVAGLEPPPIRPALPVAALMALAGGRL